MIGYIEPGITDLYELLDQVLAVWGVRTEVLHKGKEELGELELGGNGVWLAVESEKGEIRGKGQETFGVLIIRVFDKLG